MVEVKPLVIGDLIAKVPLVSAISASVHVRRHRHRIVLRMR